MVKKSEWTFCHISVDAAVKAKSGCTNVASVATINFSQSHIKDDHKKSSLWSRVTQPFLLSTQETHVSGAHEIFGLDKPDLGDVGH